MKIPLGIGAYKRSYAKEPEVKLVNRFFEQNPTNLVDSVALLSRPGTTKLTGFGNDYARALYTQEGAFDGDLFAVMGTGLYRYSEDGTTTPISGTVADNGNPSIDVMSGPGYQFLFIADGDSLQYYEGLGFARGNLSASGVINDADEVEIGGVYYQWTSGSVDAGTPDGSSSDPWLVDLGADTAEALDNLFKAINLEGTAGVTYSTGLTAAHPTVEADSVSDDLLQVKARTAGSAGNSTSTTVVTGVNLSWGDSTLTGGGTHSLRGVVTPDDVGIVSVVSIAGHIIAVVSQSQRFYYLRPGEVEIDPLDFAEAESEPDQVIEALRVGDLVWLIGQSSTEAWYASGDPVDVFLPSRGQAFSRGAIEGTPVVVKDQVVLVGNDGIVYRVGGGIERISTNGIEEQIRIALKQERLNG